MLGEKGAMACTVAVTYPHRSDHRLILICINQVLFESGLCQIKNIITFHPGGGSCDKALRQPGDGDDLQQPDAGREPDRGDQAVPRRRAESPRYRARSWGRGRPWIQFSYCCYWIWMQECYLDVRENIKFRKTNYDKNRKI